MCQGEEQILSGGDRGLGVHLQFTPEHSMQSLRFYRHSRSPLTSLCKCWYLLLVISSSWHHLLLSFIRAEQWHIFLHALPNARRDISMTQMWVTQQCVYEMWYYLPRNIQNKQLNSHFNALIASTIPVQLTNPFVTPTTTRPRQQVWQRRESERHRRQVCRWATTLFMTAESHLLRRLLLFNLWIMLSTH